MALYRIATYDTDLRQFTESVTRSRIDFAVYAARDQLCAAAKAQAALDSAQHSENMRWVLACWNDCKPLRLDAGQSARRQIRGRVVRITRED